MKIFKGPQIRQTGGVKFVENVVDIFARARYTRSQCTVVDPYNVAATDKRQGRS